MALLINISMYTDVSKLPDISHLLLLEPSHLILVFTVGFTQPTSGTAEIEGFDICRDMDRIYTLMGVCPQV
jgi:hypothetical protein